jgi:hypothetical protein
MQNLQIQKIDAGTSNRLWSVRLYTACTEYLGVHDPTIIFLARRQGSNQQPSALAIHSICRSQVIVEVPDYLGPLQHKH